MNKKFKVLVTNTYKQEFSSIINYIKYNLGETSIANKIYRIVTSQTLTLSFMPERNSKFILSKYTNRDLRKMNINNYIVIYEIDNNLRESLSFTYFS